MSEIRYQDMDIVWDDEIDAVVVALEKWIKKNQGTLHCIDIAKVAIKALRAHDKKGKR